MKAMISMCAEYRCSDDKIDHKNAFCKIDLRNAPNITAMHNNDVRLVFGEEILNLVFDLLLGHHNMKQPNKKYKFPTCRNKTGKLSTILNSYKNQKYSTLQRKK